MHWITQICKSSRANHKYLSGCGGSRFRIRHEERNHFHSSKIDHLAYTKPTRRTLSTVNHGKNNVKQSTGASLPNTRDYNTNNVNDGDTIVISGISGRFPNTDSMEELKVNLMTGQDMVTTISRWPVFHPLTPKRMGAMKNMDKFDADFFGVTPMSADAMDPQQRRLLEVAFEAIFDAGINPKTLRNTATGVYVGTMGGEAADYWLCHGATDDLEGYRMLGVVNYLQANRLSYCMDFKGPSMSLNAGCSVSLIAFESAVQAIEAGTCDQAIVAGTTVHLNGAATTEISKLGALSEEGKCRVFDDAAKGYVRSEAVVACLVQRKRDAKRHYATIRGIRSTSEGFKREGIVFPSMKNQEKLLRETYAAAGMDPGRVTYLEAHGTGTPAGDPQEVSAISKVLCKVDSRTEPLLLGSVKSNLGHTENAAGIVGVAKVCVAIEQGVIPANLHFKTPNSFVKDLFDGSLEIVDKNTPLKDGLIGISSFGIGGSIAHLILEPGSRTNSANSDTQVLAEEKNVPILIPFSGRTKETVQESLEEACKLGRNVETAALLHNVFKTNIPGHNYRGYGLALPRQNESMEPSIQIDKFDSSEAQQRPLWFIFPGMGSQWNEMGKDLMKIDAFAESIQRSQITLKNAGLGLDLNNLLRPNNPSIFDNIRDAFVAITAVQVALYDTLTCMGVSPDGFLGHSSGEILCAYADSCFSAEEALLVSDARGRAFQETKQSLGGMASVGLSWDSAKSRCPPGIYPACHNAAENVSVSGPAEDIQRFAQQLKSEGIFAREVNSCGFAPHSKYVLTAQDLLVKYTGEILKTERPRSKRWVSTSIPEKEWDTPLAQYSSPEYHANNLISPVLFHEAIQKVPNKAVVIEIAPRGLFQPLLRESLPSDCTVIAPMHHSVENKLSFFLSSVGKMYNAGVDLKIGNLYPTVHFPVSTSTPMTSSLIKWNHDRSRRVPFLCNPQETTGATYKVDLGESLFSYLEGHKLDSRCVFPATGYLVQAWQGHASVNNQYFQNFPVTFENVCFERATFLKEGTPVLLKYSFFKGTNAFVIEEDGVTIIKGNTVPSEDAEKRLFNLAPIPIPENSDPLERSSLNPDDIYKEFRLRGYNYSGEFRGIRKIDSEGRWAQVAWRGNWVSFLDTVLQTIVMSFMTRSTAIPVRFKSITIDPLKFYEYVKSQETSLEASNEAEHGQRKEILIPVSIYQTLGAIKCPGIEMRGLTAMVIPRQKQKETLSVEDYNFTPFFDDKTNLEKSPKNSIISVHSNVAGLIDLVIENMSSTKLEIIDVFSNAENSLIESITNIVNLKPQHKANVAIMSSTAELDKLDEQIKNLASNVTGRNSVEELVLAPDSSSSFGFADLIFLDEPSMLPGIAEFVKDNSFILLRSTDLQGDVRIPVAALQHISEKFSSDTTLNLFRKKPSNKQMPIQVQSAVCIDNENFDYLPKLQAAMAQSASTSGQASTNSRIYLYSQNDPDNGIIGLAKCLRMEPGGDKIRCIFDPKGKLELNFENPGDELFKIIESDLVMNVIKNVELGSYRHIPMSQNATAASKEVEHAYVNTLTTGDLTSLRWVESPLTYFDPIRDQAQGEVCTVHYAALNFRDIMLATGKLPVDSKSAYNPQDCVMGFEFSGVDSKGSRIMGMMASKALASSVLIEPGFMTWEVPKKWTLAEAATVPVVYSTAYYALFNRARLQPGQSILIHSGTGGVGQAAINIALDMNCQVYTTVGTEEKREHIKEIFPTLKDENIGNSRDCSFEQQIMELTNGRGVDLVLNSLADEKLQASVRCVAIHGKFLEIGAFDAFQNSNLGMECFLKNIELHGIFLNHFLGGSQAEKDALGSHFLNGINTGVVKPLARTVFEKNEIEEAFRFMAGGKHMGKVLIEVQKEENIGEKPKLMAVPRSYFSQDKSYVIIGGLGGLGLEVANWLVDRGVKHLVLTSRSGVSTGYQQLCLRKWEVRGVKVDIPKIDLSLYDVAENLIKDLTNSGRQIGGIFNSGLVLKDNLIEDQTVDDFKAVGAPKIQITRNLDKLTRQYCKELDYFVVFSSMSCGRGNPGQSNYGLANSAMEQICENRKEDGLHGLAIQWGVIGEVGAVAEGIFGAKLTGDEIFGGTLAQRISSCLDILDMTLHQNTATVSSMVLAEDDGKRSKKAGLLATIGHICGVKDLSTIQPTVKLVDLGMDSLIGMEIKQLIERDYDIPLTANELRAMTFNDLLMIEAGTYKKGQSQNLASTTQTSETVDFADVLSGTSATLINLKSMSSSLSGSSGSGSGSGEKNLRKLFIVHGIEGHSLTLRPLAELLNVDVFGFQFMEQSLEAGNEGNSQLTIQSLAREYVMEMKAVQSEGPYNISGYSVGGSIAFEMALLLENEFGDTVENLIVLDGLGSWKTLEFFDNRQILFESLVGIVTSNTKLSIDEEKAFKDSLNIDDPDSVIQRFVDLAKVSNSKIDSNMLRKYFTRTTILTELMEVYLEPSRKLNGKLNLIKAQEKSAWMATVKAKDRYFQEHCNTPVTIYTVQGNHETFLHADKVSETAGTINEILLSTK